MGMKFEFATAGRIIFGCGSSAEVGPICRAHGTRALVVTGSRPERADFLRSLLASAGVNSAVFPTHGEPTVKEVSEGAEQARRVGADVIVGIGGGSAVDAAKAVAALATQPQGVMHYLEVIGAGHPLEQAPLPVIALPTTAGTGAEVTRNAVLSSLEHQVKASLRHAAMLPRVAILDPALAVTCPAEVTAASGMDALTQCLEAYVSSRAQPMTDALCVEGIQRAMASLSGPSWRVPISKRGKTWRSLRCSAAWPWQMPDSVLCMVSLRLWAGNFTPPWSCLRCSAGTGLAGKCGGCRGGGHRGPACSFSKSGRPAHW